MVESGSKIRAEERAGDELKPGGWAVLRCGKWEKLFEKG